MNNIEILEEFIPLLEDGYVDNKDCTKEIQAIENLIKENKELKKQLNTIKDIYYNTNDLEELSDVLGILLSNLKED